MTIDQNAITVDDTVTYADYAPDEWLKVTIGYSATCNIVFRGLTLRRPTAFVPPESVTGEIDNVSGTPAEGSAGKTGSVTFDIRFNALSHAPSGAQSGVAHLDLALGVDKHCDPVTADIDGVDRTVAIRVRVEVSGEKGAQ